MSQRNFQRKTILWFSDLRAQTYVANFLYRIDPCLYKQILKVVQLSYAEIEVSDLMFKVMGLLLTNLSAFFRTV